MEPINQSHPILKGKARDNELTSIGINLSELTSIGINLSTYLRENLFKGKKRDKLGGNSKRQIYFY